MSRNKIIGLMVIIVIIAGLLLWRGGHAPQPVAAHDQPALTVTTAVPEARIWPQQITASGAVLAWQEASVGAELGGVRLVALHANIGDRVHQGELLARFADEALLADLQQQQAAVDEANARHSEAAANAERALKIKDSGVMSAQEAQQFANAAAIAAAQLHAAQARLENAKLKLRYTHIVAPDDGVISARSVTLGAVVQVGAELFRLIRQNRLEWRAELTETQMQQVRVGQKVQLHAGANEVLAGQVVRIAPSLDAVTRNGFVYVSVPLNTVLKAGMFTTGEFGLGDTRALTVPQSALVMRDGYAYVYRVGADRRVAQLKVTTGRREGDRVEVLSGIAADATLVASGAGFLNDGDLVSVVSAPPKLKAAGSLSLELKARS